METPQNDTNITQEQGKKRSPWLVVLIILLIIMMCCCITGVVLCRSGAMLPDFLERYLEDVPGLENADEIWSLVEDIINDPDFDPGNFDPEDFFPEDFDIPDLDELDDPEELISGSGACPSQPTEYSLVVNHNWDFSPNRDTATMKVDGWTESNSECTVIIEGSQVRMPVCAVPISNDGFIQTDDGPCLITSYGFTKITLDGARCEDGVVVAQITDVIDPDLDAGGEMVCPDITQPYEPFYPFSNTVVQFRLQPGGDIQMEEADPDTSNQFKYHKEWMLIPVQ